jgi:hypothetical protein
MHPRHYQWAEANFMSGDRKNALIVKELSIFVETIRAERGGEYSIRACPRASISEFQSKAMRGTAMQGAN